MKTLIGFLILVALTGFGTAAAAQVTTPAQALSTAQTKPDDNMTPYRNLAADTLKAFQAHDLATARKKAKELETTWDKNEKALQKTSAGIWNTIDKSMDDFIKPLADKAPDAAKVQTAYDAFIANLQLAVKES